MWSVDSIVNCPKVRAMASYDREISVALYLLPNRIVGSEYYDWVGTRGTVALPDITHVIHNCGVIGTNRVVLVHNHPMYDDGSFDSEPSETDINSTITYKDILNTKNILLADHIIVTPVEYFSFKANGLLDEKKKTNTNFIGKMRSLLFR